MIGQRFGMLRVVERGGSYIRKRTWHCVCDCGGKTIATTGNLRSGNTKSCGCEKKAAWIRTRTTHGQSRNRSHTRAYAAWSNMMTRCYNQNDAKYPRWGGRGIRVCKSWHKFENFYADMGDPPKGLSLDRSDNNKGYNPENCRWADAKLQHENRRTPKSERIYTLDGETLNLSDWSRRIGLHRDAVLKRLSYGWSVKDALTLPKGSQPKRDAK